MPLTIHEQSEQMKAAAAERLPAEVLEVFDQSIQDLLDRGIPSDSIKAGDVLEPFTLDDATGTPVGLEQIVENGPAVIVFYRAVGARIAILPCAPTSRSSSPSWPPSVLGWSPSAAVTGRITLHRGKGGAGFHRPLRPWRSSGRSGRHRIRAGRRRLGRSASARSRPDESQR